MILRKLSLIVCFSIIFVLSCSDTNVDSSVNHISLLKLFQEPNKYQGQTVSVKGYLKLDTLARLYFHREDAFYHLTENSILINLPNEVLSQIRETCNSQHSRVIGQYNERFGITNVRSISVVDLDKVLTRECWSQQ